MQIQNIPMGESLYCGIIKVDVGNICEQELNTTLVGLLARLRYSYSYIHKITSSVDVGVIYYLLIEGSVLRDFFFVY